MAPVGAVVVLYRDDLSGLVIPPQIQEIMAGNSSLFGDGGGQDGEHSLGPITPTFVSAQINPETRTFTVNVNVANNLDYNLTLNMFNATVESSQNKMELATITLASPVVIYAGSAATVTVTGAWTPAAESYLISNYADATSINVELINTTIDVNGVTIQLTQAIEVGEIPLTQ